MMRKHTTQRKPHQGADDLTRLIDEWILAAESAGIIEQGFDYWVMGRGAKSTEPRWSIIRDVLGWVDRRAPLRWRFSGLTNPPTAAQRMPAGPNRPQSPPAAPRRPRRR